jgi:hypothetical protein
METSKKINLAQLDQELNGKGLNGILDENGNYVDVSLTEYNDATEAELKAALDAHVANWPQATVAEKLASVGLSIDDLKAALGV